MMKGYSVCAISQYVQFLNGHKQTFRHEKYRNSSEISKKVWELKDKGSFTYDVITLGGEGVSK